MDLSALLNIEGSTVSLRVREFLEVMRHEMVAETNAGRACEAMLVAGMNVNDTCYASAPITARMTIPPMLKLVVNSLNEAKNERRATHG